MIDAYSADDVRAAEAPLLSGERGFAGGLMDRAAAALATAVVRVLREDGRRVVGSTVVALVGSGNNGGDTLYALARLARRGAATIAVLTSARVHGGGLAALRSSGGGVLAVTDDPQPAGSGRGPDDVWLGEAVAAAFGADVVLDGLLGIGARGGLRGPAAELVQLLAELLTGRAEPSGDVPPLRRRPGLPTVVAVDVPSGTGVDDGTVEGPVLPADRTVTFGVAKPGLLLPPAARCVGALEVVDLGLRPVLADAGREPVVVTLEPLDVAALWPVPGAGAHKYSRGVVGVVAGSSAYHGAAVLTVAGAIGAGTGMIRYVGPGDVTDAVIAAHPEVVAGHGRVQSWVLGPGTSGEDDDQGRRARDALAQAVEAGQPAVVDAGALALLPERLPPTVVLTPHAGELARLLAGRGVEVAREEVEAAPLRWAREAHTCTGATVLLKGATTVVVGQGSAAAQTNGPPWLATAGAGDVLAGVLGALLAGRAADVGDDAALVVRLAAAAAFVHGRAAHAANPGGPVSAATVAAALPGVIARLLTTVHAGLSRREVRR